MQNTYAGGYCVSYGTVANPPGLRQAAKEHLRLKEAVTSPSRLSLCSSNDAQRSATTLSRDASAKDHPPSLSIRQLSLLSIP